MPEETTIRSNEPWFFAVFVLCPVADDFKIYGIFSLESDAQEFLQKTLQEPEHLNAGAVSRMKMGQITDRLVKDHLFALAPVIEKALAAARMDKQGDGQKCP